MIEKQNQELTIRCPKCKSDIPLTESFTAPLIESTKQEYEQRLTQKDQETTEKLKQERTKIAIEEAQKAKKLLGLDLEQKSKEVSELQEILVERDAKLADAQKAQADLIKKQRELDDAKREMNLTIEKRIQAGLETVRDQAKKEAEEGLQLKVKDKEQTISSMQKQIEDLKRRAEQGSQQLQGEVQELELESILKAKFPFDSIEPVPKGEHGGDALQRVINSLGQSCGTIIWESKRTKNWQDGWLSKLRDDQRAAKAELAVIVTQALPKGIEALDQVEGVWVIHPRTIFPVATMLRNTLIEVTKVRQSSEGQQTKMELVYQYLSGPRFKQRIEAMIEAFSSMHNDLFSEKKAITKQWEKREAQIDRVMQATVGMYGDLQGIAGQTLQEIEGLEMKMLTESEKIK